LQLVKINPKIPLETLLSAKDSLGFTPVDYARQVGLQEMLPDQ
jgi:hypothetical protein